MKDRPRLHNRRTNAKGRSAGRSADTRFNKLDAIEKPFVMIPCALFDSPAFAALSGAAKSVLFVIVSVHGRAGPTENGALGVSYDAFERAGIRRASIPQALDDLDRLGFVKRTSRGHRVWGRDGGMASEYRLTWRAAFVAGELLGKTNEWARVGDEILTQPTNQAGFEGETEVKKEEALQPEYTCSSENASRETPEKPCFLPLKVAKTSLHKVAKTSLEKKFQPGDCLANLPWKIPTEKWASAWKLTCEAVGSDEQ